MVPSPSDPRVLSPQHSPVPSESTTQEWPAPLATEVALLIELTGTGVTLHAKLEQLSGPTVAPFPSSAQADQLTQSPRRRRRRSHRDETKFDAGA